MRRRPLRSGGLGRLSGGWVRRRPGRSGLSPSGTRLGGSSGGSCSGPGTPKRSGGTRMRCSPHTELYPELESSARTSRSSDCRCDRRRRCLGEMRRAARVWQLPWQHASGRRCRGAHTGAAQPSCSYRRLRAARNARPPRNDQASARRFHGEVRAAGRSGREALGSRAAPAGRRSEEGVFQRPRTEVRSC